MSEAHQSTGVNPQQALYERIHDAYHQHAFDESSLAFRRQFMWPVLFDGIDLNDKDVVELASGGGENTLEMLRLFPRARFTGYDISEKACESYREKVGRPSIQADLTRPLVPTETYDVAIIFGGIHHCVADLSQTLRNIAALVKPGGVLIMTEPSAEFVLNGIRMLWYRIDSRFDADTEAPLVHDRILEQAEHFTLRDVRYMGGPAYFLLTQSMALGVPLWVKPYTAPTLLRLEALYNRLPGRRLFPYFAARWDRRA